MKICRLMLAVAPLAIATPVWAGTVQGVSTSATAQKTDDIVSTGVARARDRLDSATSTSSLKEAEIEKIGARSLGEIFRSIPGMRAEAPGGEGNANLTIRGLPLAQGGAKFLQFQEDGLPTLEFGDIAFATSDLFLRADLNLAQIDSIRGGSASTFASNSPGGIINLISKTGEVEGGAIQATAGLDYESYRVDFDYGAKLSDTLRFHIGGFYRDGEGPRAVGYDGFKGGQVKFNITKSFDGGYIRFYGKFLDDRSPSYGPAPVSVTGTDTQPIIGTLPNFDVRSDTLLTRNFLSNLTLGSNNTVERHALQGQRALSKSFGVETQFEVSDWTVTDKFRYSANSGSDYVPTFFSFVGPGIGAAQSVANSVLAQLGIAGPAVLSYATGPNKGRTITDPSALGGNGLLAKITNSDIRLDNLNYVVNDLRGSRVWDLGNGDLTTTLGFYKSRQTIGMTWDWTSSLMEVAGNGSANLVNIAPASNPNALVTQDGYVGFGSTYLFGARRALYDLDYGVNAPYASFNYHVGKLSVGGSVRYDYGTVRGQVIGSDSLPINRRNISVDMNGDGVISNAETRVAYLPFSQATPIHYNYHYVSYSTGINYRVSEPFAMFARYSKGGRAAADRLMFDASYFDAITGAMLRPEAEYDPVQQAEFGAKYRKNGLTLNLTGFWAKTKEHNTGLDRDYRAYGLEFEGGIRRGPWNLTGSATYTKAKITADRLVASNIGHTPRLQPDLFYQVTPQYMTDTLTIGAAVIGTTGRYAADTNRLKLPGFTTVNAFIQYRPVARVLLSLNTNNLFNKLALYDLDVATVPVSGVANAGAINGRTVSTSVRFDF